MNVESGMSTSKSLLGDRYSIVKELGHSGFGKTYLAEDRQLSGELSVFQELLPQVNDRASVEKAKDLFEQEGRVLLQLAHPQIPEYKLIEVPFDTETQSGARLFLAQDYIRGQSYQEIADGRQRSKNRFKETELTLLLQQMLPVLSYIHGMELIHRDISPENLILDQIEGQPVLVNFASVKETAAKVRSRVATEGIGAAPIRVGKVGYAPQEQLSGAPTDATSDLYGLAATIMVLATGEDPETLIDTQGNWHEFELLSPKLGHILAKMLAVHPSDRFPSAQAVLTALRQEDAPVDQSRAQESSTMGATAGGAAAITSVARSMYSQPAGVIAPGESDILVGPEPELAMASPGFSPMDTPIDMGRHVDIDEVSETYEPVMARESRVIGQPSWKEALIALGVMTGFVVAALLIAWLLRGNNDSVANRTDSSSAQTADTGADGQVNSGEFTPEETARRLEIETRREELGISESFFTNLVNQLFYQEYPMLRTGGPNNGPQPMTSAPEDEPLRIRWEYTALDLLRTLEDSFDPRSLSELGSYSEANRETWRSQISEVGIEPRSLYDLVDAKFFNLFPSQAGDDFLTQPTGQLYYAIADSQAQMIVNGNLRESVAFEPGEFRQDLTGQLDPGEGQIYTAELSAGQLLRLNLNAPEDSTLMSLYPPNPTDAQPSIFSDSEQATWSGSLTETSDYELVVLNRSNEPISYELTMSVDRVTSAPVVPPKEEGLESETEIPAKKEDALNTDNGVVFDRLEDSPGLGINSANGSSATSERR